MAFQVGKHEHGSRHAETGSIWAETRSGSMPPTAGMGPKLTFSYSAGGWEPWEVCEQEGHKVSVCFWK